MSRSEIQICPCCEAEIECDCIPRCLEGEHEHECFYCQETLDEEDEEGAEGDD